ncbi:MAG: nicotinate-nicotinamide nucleotide adenylyltransferase [Chlamydiales bacterium]|nr:nicotinate-nicotinamide nucleotide adenylyltransferase [Chlamydiales bacterium]
MKIGLFGGTFNPIHFGHINLVITLMEKNALDCVWWIPALTSPFKQDEHTALPHHRLEMVKLAVKGIPNCEVLPLEIHRPAPSYTVDTIEALFDGQNEFFLLLADDAYARFDEWKNHEVIRERVEILVGSRKGMEISGTQIRERLKKGLYCGHLVPANVLDYIHEHQLYFIP